MDQERQILRRHLLVTISEQEKNLHACRFVADYFTRKEDLDITLFYTAPRTSAGWDEEASPQDGVRRAAQQKEYEIKGRQAVEAARRLLTSRGFPDSRISSKVQVRKISKVLDIIREGKQGLYDAVVLGRRGLSWLEQAFDESVTGEFLKTRVDFPVWVCRKPEPGRKNALVCVDGSDAGFRVTDHVGFMLADQEDQEITLMTVVKSLSAAGDGGDALFGACRRRLETTGFPEGRTRFKLVESGNAAKAILREAEQARFGVVAVGRTGLGKGRGLFMGSVSSTLFKELERACLWMCY
jgi:nucleotide-binding universal stress UspA family protein